MVVPCALAELVLASVVRLIPRTGILALVLLLLEAGLRREGVEAAAVLVRVVELVPREVEALLHVVHLALLGDIAPLRGAVGRCEFGLAGGVEVILPSLAL